MFVLMQIEEVYGISLRRVLGTHGMTIYALVDRACSSVFVVCRRSTNIGVVGRISLAV